MEKAKDLSLHRIIDVRLKSCTCVVVEIIMIGYEFHFHKKDYNKEYERNAKLDESLEHYINENSEARLFFDSILSEYNNSNYIVVRAGDYDYLKTYYHNNK